MKGPPDVCRFRFAAGCLVCHRFATSVERLSRFAPCLPKRLPLMKLLTWHKFVCHVSNFIVCRGSAVSAVCLSRLSTRLPRVCIVPKSATAYVGGAFDERDAPQAAPCQSDALRTHLGGCATAATGYRAEALAVRGEAAIMASSLATTERRQTPALSGAQGRASSRPQRSPRRPQQCASVCGAATRCDTEQPAESPENAAPPAPAAAPARRITS
jgi:hypothetical protein